MSLVAALVAWTGVVSCAGGIHDTNDEPSVATTIGIGGGHIAMMEAVLDVPRGSLSSDQVIRVSRFKSIGHTGALSPVFEIEVPEQTTFSQDPTIGILTTPQLAADADQVIGFLVPAEQQWIPVQGQTSTVPCDPSTVCGPVQSEAFTRHKTTVLDFAIVTLCAGGRDCPAGQSCASSGACQQCPEGSACP